MTADEDLDRYSDYRQGEIDSAFIYRALAELEDKPPLADHYAAWQRPSPSTRRSGRLA